MVVTTIDNTKKVQGKKWKGGKHGKRKNKGKGRRRNIQRRI